MKNGCTVLLLSFFIVSCSAWERGQAKTVEQKRDFLLKYGPQFVPGYLSKTPLSIYELRKQVVNGGGETTEFLHQLVDECYTSHLDYCTIEKYFVAKEKIDKEKKRRNKVPVKKGELFYCKVKIHHELGPVDSTNIRVGVKDNIDTVGFIFPNGYQIISPKLEVVDLASGDRYGRSSDGTKEVGASYDGNSYSITLFDEYEVRKFNGAAITHTSKLEISGRIDAWDCKKAK